MNTKQNLNENDHDESSSAPYLLNSSTFPAERKTNFGDFNFKKSTESDSLIELSNNDCTVEWTKPPQIAWIPVPTNARLHSGKWSLEFHVESMQNHQIGVGFLLNWNLGPDWGFFGYLGASSTAWSYDPSTGDIVSGTKSIHDNLPKFTKDSGIIGLELDLPVNENGSFTFIIDGVRTPTKPLPAGAVAVPAVCLLKIGQKVTLQNVLRSN